MEKVKQKLQKYLYFDAWQRWEYKHTTLVIVGLLVFILLLNTSFITTAVDLVGYMGYAGVFIAGILFVSLFTAVPAVVLLLSFGDLNLLTVALVAGFGAMIGDYLILKYVEKEVAYELKPLAYHFGIPQAVAYLQGRKSTVGLVRLFGALIIISPLPDEIGIGLLDMGRLSRTSFLAVCYAMNVLGILIIMLLGSAF